MVILENVGVSWEKGPLNNVRELTLQSSRLFLNVRSGSTLSTIGLLLVVESPTYYFAPDEDSPVALVDPELHCLHIALGAIFLDASQRDNERSISK